VVGFIVIIPIGLSFICYFLFTIIRYSVYKKTGYLLTGKIVGYELTHRGSRCIIQFVYKKAIMRLSSFQVYSNLFSFFTRPHKDTKVEVYYSEKYNDHVLVAKGLGIFSLTIILLFGVAFLAFGLLGLLGYIEVR